MSRFGGVPVAEEPTDSPQQGRFGGVPVEEEATSRFGGIPIQDDVGFWEGVGGSFKRGAVSARQAAAFGRANIAQEEARRQELEIQQEQELFDYLVKNSNDRQAILTQKAKLDDARNRRQQYYQERADFITGLAQLEVEKATIPMSEGYREFVESEDWWKAFKKNPVEVFANIATESLAQSAPTLVATTALAPLGPGGVAAGAAGGSFVQEQASAVLEYLQAEGVDLSDKDAVLAALQNKDLMQRVTQKASKKASVVSVAAGVSGGVAGRFNPFTEAIIQTSLDAAGEAGGQLFATGEVSGKDVFMEVAGGLPQSTVETASGYLNRRSSRSGSESEVDSTVAPGQMMPQEGTVTREVAVEDAEAAPATSINAVESIMDEVEFAQTGEQTVEGVTPEVPSILEEPMLSQEEMQILEEEPDRSIPIEEQRVIEDEMQLEQEALAEYDADLREALQEQPLSKSDQALIEDQFKRVIQPVDNRIDTPVSFEPLKATMRARLQERVKGEQKIAQLQDKFDRRINNLEAKFRKERESRLMQAMTERQKRDRMRVKAEERLAKEVSKRVKEVQRRYRERGDLQAAVQLLQEVVNQMPLSIRGKFKGFPQLTQKIGPDAQLAYLQKASNRVTEMIDDYAIRRNQKTLSRVVKLNTPKRNNRKRLANRIPLDTQRQFERITEIAQMDRDKVDARLEELQSVEEPSDAQKEEMFNLRVFGGKLNRKETHGFTGKEMRLAREEAEYIAREGRNRFQAQKEMEKLRHEAMVDEAVNAITGGQPLKSTKATEYRAKQFWKKAKDFISTELNRWNSFEWLLDSLTKTGEQLKGDLQKYYEATHAAQNRKFRNVSARVKQAELFVERLYASKGRKLLSVMRQNEQMVENTGVFAGKEQVPLSFNQGVSAWMQWQDKSLRKTFERMGWNDDTFRQLEAFIGQNGVDMGQYLMAEYADYYDSINAIFSKVEGYDLPRVENYSPIRRKGSPDIDDNAWLKQNTPQATAKNGSLIERKSNTEELMFDDALATFSQHVVSMEHYKQFARLAKDLRAVFLNSKTERAVTQEAGVGSYRVLKRFVEDIINGGTTDRFQWRLLDKVRTNVTTATLGLNPSIFLKQLTSIPAYANAIPAGEYAKGLGSFWADPVKNTQTLMQSEYLQERISEGHDRDVKDAIAGFGAKRMFHVNRLRNKLMFLTRFGDMAAIIQGGWPIYEYHYKKAKEGGASELVARRKAMQQFELTTKNSQQSSRLEDMSELQRGNSFNKLFTMYMTAPASYFRFELAALRNMKRKRITKKQFAKQIAIYHFILPNLFQLASNAFLIPFGEWGDDDQLDELLRRHLRATLVGSLNGYMILGDFLESAVDVWTGGPDFLGEQGSPVMQMLSDIAKEIPRGLDGLGKWLSGDDEAEVMEVIQDLSAPIEAVTGFPVETVAEYFQTIDKIAQDESENPMLELLGYSDYARAVPKK